MERNTMVIVENLNKYYGKHHILKDISFSINKNEIVGFIGPNGAGKSTTMKCLCSLVIPDSGRIIINGHDLSKDRENALRAQASLIENPGLYLDMSGRQNLRFFAKLKNVSKERLIEIEEFTKLGSKLDIKVSKYSMGMKQRLGLGIALLGKPRFLILDEPSNGLDPTGIIDLRNTLEELKNKEDVCVLFSSHQLGEVEKLADKIICINNGRIIDIPSITSERYNYRIQLSDLEKSKPILEAFILSKELEILSDNSVKTSFSNPRTLSDLLLQLLLKGIDILDISRDIIDIESIYKNVYGDNNV